MAKRKAAKPPKGKKGDKRSGKPNGHTKQTKQEAEGILKNGPIRGKPKEQPLPGMENLGQIRELDGLCRNIRGAREQMADLRADEGGYVQSALNVMRKHNRTTYRQHGVELVRVPGEEKLRVRTSKESASAETEDPDDVVAMDAEDEDEGDGFEHVNDDIDDASADA